MNSSSDSKKTLRQQLLVMRMGLPENIRDAAAISLSKQLAEMVPAGAVVAGYAPSNHEIDVLQYINDVAFERNTVVLPVVAKPEKILKFLEWKKGDVLVAGAYGILQPGLSAREIIPDVVFVPLVGFDVQGNRLGYGGGYYDATIRALRAQNSAIKIIGVAYSAQAIEQLPAEPHDERLDAVVTEREVIRFT